MPLSHFPRFRTLFLSIVGFCTTIAILIAYNVLIHDVLPIRRAYYLETDYLYQRANADFTKFMSESPDGKVPQDALRLYSLMSNVAQLHYWSIPTTIRYDEWLSLYFDGLGLGDHKGSEYWIYFGGTSEAASKSGEKEEDDAFVFEHRYKKHSCTDPPHMCTAYQAAFNRVYERWPGINKSRSPQSGTSKANLRYVDCDVSPLLCDGIWGLPVAANMLIHMKIGHECDNSIEGIERCSVTWRIIGLPIRKLPWTRRIRIRLDSGGTTVVPAFPDAEEQLWTLMAYAGAEEGLVYYPASEEEGGTNWVLTVEPAGYERPKYSHRLGLESWAVLRTFMDFPLGLPRELLVRCYLERWLDLFLRWWDGPPHVVYPRSCVDVEGEHERSRKRMDVMDDLVKNHGIHPNQMFMA
ncbi:hypothetical protein BKA66DRAFT_198948 [Pyrenochaeta sp. MPI-SDFR-AT-0127]|nr:hypothetical protein BKA66DRAFT_198948 [Pyrenochaeta sp. MPI-SDFR-AT-0127]